VFDMDNTLIKGSFIHQLAKAKGFEKELGDIVVQNNNDFMRTKRIAQLLKGIPYAEMLAVVDEIPLVEDAEQVIAAFRERGYVCGIISDSYDCIAHHIKVKLNMDFALANELEFSKSVATGEVKIPSYYCKSNVLMHVASNYGIELKNSIAVGDAENDICMFNAAGIGVAFNARSKMVEQFADVVVVAGSFAKIIEIAAD
jgi:glucosyl-3-phosphoglycerate synthase